MSDDDDDSLSQWSLLGVSGLASLCCLGPGAAAVGGTATVGALGGDLLQVGVTALVLAVAAVVVRRRTCQVCEN
jgi:hypothetical protein